VLPVDATIFETFGRLSAARAQSGTAIGDSGEVIAATALTYEGEIITRDRHFSRVPNLKVIPY